jgi:2-amino-4-hydroxy-6-hydroxymethyldihydropteridine diphosphokinase
MKMYRVFLGLGSNIGDRQRYLSVAVAEMKKLRDTTVIWTSSVYETDPVGKTDQPKFLNAVVELETGLPPAELFHEVKSVEERMGRSPGERWSPREIDIDILIYDGLAVETERLTVPHPDLGKRKFVLVPLCEIAPDLVHPVNGMTMEELLAACREPGRVVKSIHKILV